MDDWATLEGAKAAADAKRVVIRVSFMVSLIGLDIVRRTNRILIENGEAVFDLLCWWFVRIVLVAGSILIGT